MERRDWAIEAVRHICPEKSKAVHQTDEMRGLCDSVRRYYASVAGQATVEASDAKPGELDYSCEPCKGGPKKRRAGPFTVITGGRSD